MLCMQELQDRATQYCLEVGLTELAIVCCFLDGGGGGLGPHVLLGSVLLRASNAESHQVTLQS